MAETIMGANLGGSLVTSTSVGTSVGLDVNVISGGALSNIVGSVYELGLSNFEIIRKNSGSPFVNYVFSNLPNSFLVQNLGSAPVYYTFNGSANPAGEGTAFLQGNDGISFNLKVGSITIQSSGITSSSVQVIRIS